MLNKLKDVGYYIVGIVIMFFLLLIGAFLIKGAVWVGEHVLQWLINFAWIIFALNLLLLLPFSFFKKTRIVGAPGMYISSYVFGITLWFLGLLLTYFNWGFLGVIIGLVIAGVGIVPIAMLATLLNGDFFSLFVLIILTVLTFGLRALGIYLFSKIGVSGDSNEFISQKETENEI